jgi:hypothetical protein
MAPLIMEKIVEVEEEVFELDSFVFEDNYEKPYKI